MLLDGVNSFGWIASQQDAPSTAPGAAVTPGSGTKGSYEQLFASASVTNDVYGVLLWIVAGNTTASIRNILLDIGVDPAGGTNYQPIVSDILCSQAANAVYGGRFFYFPIFIKSGSSIAARAQSNSTSTVRVAATLFGRPSRPDAVRVGQYSETIGAVPASNGGTGFTPGNTGAEGSWTSLGTTTRPCWWWQLCIGISNSTTTSLMYHCDLAVGDGTSYHVIVQNLPVLLYGTAEQTATPLWLNGFWEVPAGANLYVRGSCSGTTATGFQATAIGIGG